MKFLSDAQAPENVIGKLRHFGWDIRTARQEGIENEPRDERIVRHALKLGRTVLAFDLYRGETRALVSEQLRTMGGWVLTIAGGPAQPEDEAIGKLYYHRPKWYPFLSGTHGWVEIKDLRSGQIGCELRKSSDLRTVVKHDEIEQFRKFLSRGNVRSTIRVKRPRETPPGQLTTDFNGADLGGSLPGLFKEAAEVAGDSI